MRAALASVLAATVAASSGGTVVAWPNAAAASAVEPSPEELYKEGRKAYRLGRYQEAVENFESAYAASDNALLLFNIGLAYKNWFNVSKSAQHLRKAKAVFQNYLLEAQRDPNLGADIKEVEDEIREVDELLAKAEEAEREKAAADAARQSADKPVENKPRRPTGPDPGKKLRLGGVIAMGVGGLFTLTGIVVGTVFGLRGQEFSDELGNLYNDRDDNNCKDEPNAGDCPDILNDIEITRDNGQKANLLMGVSFGAIAGLGIAALIAGGVVYATANKRSKEWKAAKSARIRVSPTFGGAIVSGKF